MDSNYLKTFVSLKYSTIVDGKDSKSTQNYNNIKLDATDEDIYEVFKIITPLLKGTGSEILKTNVYELTE